MFMAFTRLLDRAHRVGVCGATRWGSASPLGGGSPTTWNYNYAAHGGGFSGFFTNFFHNFVGRPAIHQRQLRRSSQASLQANGGTFVPSDDAHDRAVLLPVRVRRDHPAPLPRKRARAHQVQGVADLRALVVHPGLHRQRHAHLGWRLLGARRRPRLLGWVRHPPGRRDIWFRGGSGHRPPPGPGPSQIRARTTSH